MGARYVYRMDDITPTMDWERFGRFMELFGAHGVVPLLGVVPDNRDRELMPHAPKPNAWREIRRLKDEGRVEVAQHGFQHLSWLVGRADRSKGVSASQKSEFAGLSYEIQFNKISAGKAILEEVGLASNVWMAPFHAQDDVTLQVLNDLGFRSVTDGTSLYPVTRGGLIHVPQQLWRPRYAPMGVWTICIHSDEASEALFARVERHLMDNRSRVIPFSEAVRLKAPATSKAQNAVFKLVYGVARSIRRRK